MSSCSTALAARNRAADLLQWTSEILQAVVAWRARHPGELVHGGGPIDGVQRAQIDFEGATFPLVTIGVPGLRDAASSPAREPQEWMFT